jgi:hypothetical protein
MSLTLVFREATVASGLSLDERLPTTGANAVTSGTGCRHRVNGTDIANRIPSANDRRASLELYWMRADA